MIEGWPNESDLLVCVKSHGNVVKGDVALVMDVQGIVTLFVNDMTVRYTFCDTDVYFSRIEPVDYYTPSQLKK